jgi:transposase
MPEEKSRRRTPYPAEMRERAIRMVLDHRDEYPSQWAAIGSVAEKLSINRETLRLWVRRAEVDAGSRPGLTTDEREKLRTLEREVKELRRANEILKAAASFFARELDPRPPRS